MQITSLAFTTLISLVLNPRTAHSTTALVSFDRAYNISNTPLSAVACSDGPNGLITRGFTTFGSLPTFPNIGGAAVVTGWNSPNCGACFLLSSKNKTSGAARSVYVLIVDHTDVGFNVALPALEALEGPGAASMGTALVEAKRVEASFCGLR